MSAEEPLLPIIPGTNGAANPFTNDVQAATWRMMGRRRSALNNAFTPQQSVIRFPTAGGGGFSNISVQGTNAASSVINVDGKLLAISATAATVSGLTNCTSSTLSGPVGDPFNNVPATDANTNLPQTWFLVLGHHAYDLTSEAKLELTYLNAATSQVYFKNTNQLGNLFTGNVFSGTSALTGRPVSVIGYSWALARHERVLPYADRRSTCTGLIQSVPAVTNAAGAIVLPAGPAPGIIRTDGLRLDISQCRGNQFRTYDAAGVYRAATVAATSTAQVIYLTGATWTANVGAAVWCGAASARATAGKDVGNCLEFYRGVTKSYLGLDLNDSIGGALKPAATIDEWFSVDGMCELDPVNVFDVDYNTTDGLSGAGDDNVVVCGRPIDLFEAPRFPWTIRGQQIYVRNLAGGGWVRDPGSNAVSAIPLLNFAEIDLDAKALMNAYGSGITNTINVQVGSCTAVVGFSGTNTGSNNQVTTSIVPPYVPVRCFVSFHSDDGNYIPSRAVYTGSNTITLSDDVTVNSGTGASCVNGRAMVVTFGESSVEPNQVRAPFADSLIWTPSTGGSPPGPIDPPTYSAVGSFSFLPKSQSLLSRRIESVDYNTPQGFSVENSDPINAFTNRTLALFAGSNFMQPGIRDAGNVFFTGDGPTDTYYVRHHVGKISEQNPAHQGIRDSLRSGTVVSSTSFSITTTKDFTLDPIWGGVAISFTSSNTTATGTSVTFTSPGTNTSLLFPQYGTNPLSLQIDTGTGTNAGLWNPAYRVDRISTGIASSGANLVVSFTNTASGLAGLPTKLSLPKKPNCWKDYILNVSGASASWTARVAANTGGTLFFPTTTNTISAGDSWRVGYLNGHDMLGTGTVIECDSSGTPGSWTFKTEGADNLRLFVKSPQNFLPDPRSNLEGFGQRWGPVVPGTSNIIEVDNQIFFRLLAMDAYLGTDGGASSHGLTDEIFSSVGIGSGDRSSTNSISVLFADADAVAGGGSPTVFDVLSHGTNSVNAAAQSEVSVKYGKPVVTPGELDTGTASQFDTIAPYYDFAGGPFLRGLTATCTAYGYATIDGGDSNPVAYNSGVGGNCGANGTVEFMPGSTGLVWRKFAPIGSFGGTSATGSVGPVGSLTAGPRPSGGGGTVLEPILDSDFNTIGCTTNVAETDFVNASGGYFVQRVALVVKPDYATAATAGW